ncbi:hypothetical protein DEAC_c00540 [Desulfosporosinus acididurans]|uniref:Uncharacterized protein n=1 Tax=Desulfosporosinus acididurans TaxID=476652 RepID=A0A0J1FW52_9FIRM|nr:hypothetical protein [Desulfosporosinus acididurans]KLU67660.1 hypothetical protein DEAC_c00540 [Desulfosporosinus acididurans]
MNNKFKVLIFICMACIFCLPLQVQAQAQTQTNAPTSSQLTNLQTQSNSAKETPNKNDANELQQFAEQELKLNSQFSNQTEQELALDMKILSLQQSLQTINEGITNDQSALESHVSSQVKPATFRHKPYNILLLCNSLPMLESVAVSRHV